MKVFDMSDSERLSELLLEWEAGRESGATIDVSALCADCPELTRRLHEMIDQIVSVESILGMTITADLTRMPNNDESESLASLPTIEGYEVQEVLDRGGMGIVYKAKQIELQRIVALKMMHEFHLSDRRIARFRIEAESVAKIQHTNIVQIFDSGESNGRPWFSMEYVPGGSLKDHIQHKLPEPRETAELVLTLAIAVHATHEHGIVHRDLKPSNVLLTNTGKPKLADFGLAKHLDGDSENTRTGEIIGTPNYMAPEQAEGASDLIGPAVDVYAIGTILYEMLVGEPPFNSPTPLEALRRVTTEEPAFPPEARSKLPRDLQLICLQCLQKKPSDRYANAALVADDLERFLTGRPIHADSIGPIGRTTKWIRRRPDLAALTVACSVLIIALAFMAGDRYRAEKDTRQLATKLAPQALEILRRNCAQCHGNDPRTIQKDLNVLDHNALLSSNRRIVVAGVPGDSRLIQRIADGSMPPEEDEETLPRVSEKELSILHDWIAGGAPEFPIEDPKNPTPPVVPYSSIAAEVHNIFHDRCYSCHRRDVAKGGIKILNHRLLLTVRKMVVPGLPDESELFHLITTDVKDPLVMPPANKPRLSSEEIAIIRRWIAEGAAPFPRVDKHRTKRP
jgi:tRNA A-37 threonylcarbamoyl transferase component Bud32/mono/diheme cytochrome c family protein